MATDASRGTSMGVSAASARIPPAARRDSQNRRRRRDEQALGQELRHEPPPARADRRAHRDLSRARRRPREQEARDVDAGDEEEQPHRAQQDEQRRPEEPDDLAVQLDDAGAPAVVGPHVLAPEPRGERVELALRLLHRAARREPPHRLHEVRRAAVLREIPHQPVPDIGVARKVKAGRHDARHLIVVVVHANELADDRGVALEPRAPEAMADEHEPIARVERPVGRKAGSEHGAHAHHRLEVPARPRSS